ncbi:L,D-transpeptidase [Fulvimonas soli]|nr:L,D-transpeptidase [Fulvimonas soli]
MMPRLLLCFVLLALSGLSVWAASAVPTWGARQSSPVDTPPASLRPGEWIWAGGEKMEGPLAVIVSLTEQRAYVYRNGILIGVSTISSGRPGYETPTGVFAILQKDRNHRSNKYDNAPMPYQQRLTWDGVALHAGGLPGYPESHGCVHLPTEFARRLFDVTNLGMTVVVSKEGSAPVSVVHPRAISPIDPQSGNERAIPPLADGEAFSWHPQDAPAGPLSLVLSVADQRVVVYRSGVEIGRSRIAVRDPLPGTHAFIVADGYMPDQLQWAGVRMPNWITIGIPGHADEGGKPVEAELINRVTVPPEFMARLMPLLTPGVVLLATDAPILPGTSGGPLQVLDSDPPATTP